MNEALHHPEVWEQFVDDFHSILIVFPTFIKTLRLLWRKKVMKI